MHYDQLQAALAAQVAPPDADPDATIAAVAVLAGAAALHAARLADSLNAGAGLSREARDQWGAIAGMLLEIADHGTPGASQDWHSALSFLDLCVQANAERLAELRARPDYED